MIGESAARLNHGHLTHADGNADWVLTIFSALSLVSENLSYCPLLKLTLLIVNASFTIFGRLFKLIMVAF